MQNATPCLSFSEKRPSHLKSRGLEVAAVVRLKWNAHGWLHHKGIDNRGKGNRSWYPKQILLGVQSMELVKHIYPAIGHDPASVV
jgi:hypothetical protein